MLIGSMLGRFFPGTFGDGSSAVASIVSLVGVSAFHFMILWGVEPATFVNTCCPPSSRSFALVVLARAIGDAGTATSALIPWNSCGAYVAAILAAPTLASAPFAFIFLLARSP